MNDKLNAISPDFLIVDNEIEVLVYDIPYRKYIQLRLSLTRTLAHH